MGFWEIGCSAQLLRHARAMPMCLLHFHWPPALLQIRAPFMPEKASRRRQISLQGELLDQAASNAGACGPSEMALDDCPEEFGTSLPQSGRRTSECCSKQAVEMRRIRKSAFRGHRRYALVAVREKPEAIIDAEIAREFLYAFACNLAEQTLELSLRKANACGDLLHLRRRAEILLYQKHRALDARIGDETDSRWLRLRIETRSGLVCQQYVQSLLGLAGP